MAAMTSSPPLAGAWIEIALPSDRLIRSMVAPPRGGVD